MVNWQGGEQANDAADAAMCHPKSLGRAGPPCLN